jgi:hypothetical protein
MDSSVYSRSDERGRNRGDPGAIHGAGDASGAAVQNVGGVDHCRRTLVRVAWNIGDSGFLVRFNDAVPPFVPVRRCFVPEVPGNRFSRFMAPQRRPRIKGN